MKESNGSMKQLLSRLVLLAILAFFLSCAGEEGGETTSGELINKGPANLVLSSIQPTTGKSGDTILLKGVGLSIDAIAAVKFGNVGSLILQVNDLATELQVLAPAQASGFINPVTVTVQAKAGGESSLGGVFTYTANTDCSASGAAPIITNIAAVNLVATHQLVMDGDHFDVGVTVNLVGIPLNLTTVTPTQIVADLPIHPENLCSTFPCDRPIAVGNTNGCAANSTVQLQMQGLPVEKIFSGLGEYNYGTAVVSMKQDRNGDGVTDFSVLSNDRLSVVSADLNSSNYNQYTLWNQPLETTNIICKRQAYGSNLISVGDLNNNGINDLIISQYYPTTTQNVWEQRLCMISGDGTAFDTFTYGTGSYFDPAVVIGVKDFDGDQKADLIVGNKFHNYFGGSYLTVVGEINIFTGNKFFDGNPAQPTPNKTFQGESSAAGFGAALENMGDLDGDGKDEFIVGAPSFSINGSNLFGGAIYLYSTNDLDLAHPAATPAYRKRITNPDNVNSGVGTLFGYSVKRVDDMNGDGKADIIVAGYGMVWGISGADLLNVGNPTPLFRITTIGNLYPILSNAGDMNGDGRGDFAIGDIMFNANPGSGSTLPAFAGRVVVYSGNFVIGTTPSALFARYGVYNSEQMGRSIENLGDINNDGVSELLIGAPRGNLMDGHVYLMSMYSAAATYPPFP